MNKYMKLVLKTIILKVPIINTYFQTNNLTFKRQKKLNHSIAIFCTSLKLLL